MNQVPCAMAPYVVQQAFVPAPQAQPQPKLNAVNIEINNPTVGNQGAAQQPQYAPVTMHRLFANFLHRMKGSVPVWQPSNPH